MKLLYACLKHDYGVKENGLNELSLNGFIPAFEKHINTSLFFYDEFIHDKGLMTHKFDLAIQSESPDIIFIDTYLDIFEKSFLQKIMIKYTTLGWFGDDQWRFDNFSSNYAGLFSAIVTTDKYAISKYHKLGQEKVILSHWGVINSPEVNLKNSNSSSNFKHDIVFIGRIHPYRKWFIEQLSSSGFKVEAYGPGWKSGKLTFEHLLKIYKNSKICLNVSNAVSYDIRHLSLTSPRSISTMLRSDKKYNPTNARLMEIPYYGGFQLAEYGSPVEDYFEIGKEIACYRSIDDAKILLRYYLENDKKREEIRLNGYKRARKEYDYNSIVQNIIREINEL